MTFDGMAKLMGTPSPKALFWSDTGRCQSERAPARLIGLTPLNSDFLQVTWVFDTISAESRSQPCLYSPSIKLNLFALTR